MRKSLFLLLVVLAFSLFSVNVLAQDQFQRWPDDQFQRWPDINRVPPPPPPHRVPPPGKADPQQVTLFSRIGYKDWNYGRSAFSFYGVRSDDKEWLRIARKRAHLAYGSISIDHDTDWFTVSM